MKDKGLRQFSGSVLLLAVILFTGISAYAEMPRTINYQGFLTNAAGNSVNDTMLMTFRIYDNASAPMGGQIWIEEHFVTIKDGVYNVVLGPFPAHLTFDRQYYLGIAVLTDPEMTPRQPLTGVPYAMRSAVADTTIETDPQVGTLTISKWCTSDGTMVNCTSNTPVMTETDPTVNALGKASLSCTSGQVAKWNGTAWVCSTDTGVTSESDPTVPGSIKDGVAWTEITNRPTGLDDGDNVGLTSETDPTVPASIKDGIGWGEISGIPAGFADGVDNDSAETDPLVNTLGKAYLPCLDNQIAKVIGGVWTCATDQGGSGTADGDWIISGSNMYSGVAGNVGIGTPNPNTKLMVVRPDGDYGEGKASIYGERNGTSGAANGGTSWVVDKVDAAIKGYSYYGNQFTAGVAGYSYMDYANSAGVVGAKQDGTHRGILGYRETDQKYWAGYFEGDGYFSGNVGIGINNPTAKLHVVAPGNLGIESEGLYGIHGKSSTPMGYGIWGENAGDFGMGGYFSTSGTNGIAVYAQATGAGGTGILASGGTGGYAAIFDGNVKIISKTSGATVVELGEGLDYAEGFDVSNMKDIAAGTVLIIDPDNPGKLAISDIPYDTRVAGIVAGAKALGSGVRLGAGQFDHDVALAGRVYCNVDATYGEIKPGDLLTTSSTTGYAMAVKDHSRSQGAILGKAMEKLEQGKKGQILVLVTLQ